MTGQTVRVLINGNVAQTGYFKASRKPPTSLVVNHCRAIADNAMTALTTSRLQERRQMIFVMLNIKVTLRKVVIKQWLIYQELVE